MTSVPDIFSREPDDSLLDLIDDRIEQIFGAHLAPAVLNDPRMDDVMCRVMEEMLDGKSVWIRFVQHQNRVEYLIVFGEDT